MRKALFATLSGFLVLFVGYLGYHHLNPAYSYTEADYPLHDLQSMEQESDFIIIGELSGQIEQHVETIHEGQEAISWYTISEVEVKQVFEGNVNEGDKLQVMEPYATHRTMAGAETMTTGNYYPMNQGEEYILFLAESQTDVFPEGTYEPISHYQGVHVIQDPTDLDLSPQALEINHHDSHYENLHQKVIEKYMQ